MKSLSDLIQFQLAVIFLAPPGYGKTSILMDLIQKSNQKFIFISPLKELSLEVFERMDKEIDCMFNPDLKDKNWSKKKMLVVTPEKFQDCFLQDRIVILDEIHLFYHWDNFRPHLRDVFMSVATGENPLWCLTATLNSEYSDFLKEDLLINYNDVILLDLGNHKLLRKPYRNIYVLKFWQKYFQRNFHYLLKKNKTSLVFLPYRQSVDDWEEKLLHSELRVIGCKSVSGMYWGKTIKELKPEVILSTSVLSHGVNLGKIEQVFITYLLENKDFWIQMAARGGRNGEKFTLITLDPYFKSNIFLNFFHNLILVFRMFYGSLLEL